MNYNLAMKLSFSKKFMTWFLLKTERFDKENYGNKKRALFKNLKGKVLEIGPGTGVNLNYYPKNIKWIGIEPNPKMQEHVKEKIKRLKIDAKIKSLRAEKIPEKTNSIDFVISTLVLCSVDKPEEVLAEIRRVLKKGDKFLFIEHVADKPGTLRRFFQNLAPYTPWKLFSDNCRTNRETWKTIENAGFKKVKIKHFKQNKGKFNLLEMLIKPHIMGEAVK